MVEDLLKGFVHEDWLKLPDQAGLRRTFTRWIYHVFIKTRAPQGALPEVNDLEEAQTMLSKTVVEWTKQWKKEGLEKGREEGREEGLEKGRELMARTLVRQIERKFGELNESDRQRVLGAKTTDLEKWADRIIDAATLREIFKH